MDRIEELEELVAEAYIVVGALADKAGLFENPAVNKCLDNLAAGKLVHGDVIPFVIPNTEDLQQPVATVTCRNGEWFGRITAQARKRVEVGEKLYLKPDHYEKIILIADYAEARYLLEHMKNHQNSSEHTAMRSGLQGIFNKINSTSVYRKV